MDKNTKITLAELIKRKEQVLEAKKNVKRARVYVKSLGGEIVIKAPQSRLQQNRRKWKGTVTLTLFMSVLPNRIYIQKNFRRHTAVHIPKKS